MYAGHHPSEFEEPTRIPFLHRLLGFAGIYARLDHQAVAINAQARALRFERARNDRQDKDMATLAENASKLLAAETALEGEFDTLEAAYEALKNAPVQTGDTVTPETEAAIQQVTDAFESLRDRMAAVAAPTDPTTPDVPSTPEP